MALNHYYKFIHLTNYRFNQIFFDAENEYSRRNCLERQVLEELQVKWSKNGHFGQIYEFNVGKWNFLFISEKGIA